VVRATSQLKIGTEQWCDDDLQRKTEKKVNRKIKKNPKNINPKGKTSEMMAGFCFVISIRGLNDLDDVPIYIYRGAQK
jgi:hypothetical protein